MKNVNTSFSVLAYRIKFIITDIQPIGREEDASVKRRNLRIRFKMNCPVNKLFSYEQCVLSNKL